MTNTRIPYGRQSLDEEDLAAVRRVMQGDWLTQGPAVPEFEEAVADLWVFGNTMEKTVDS